MLLSIFMLMFIDRMHVQSLHVYDQVLVLTSRLMILVSVLFPLLSPLNKVRLLLCSALLVRNTAWYKLMMHVYCYFRCRNAYLHSL